MNLEQILLPLRQWRLGRQLRIFTSPRVVGPILISTGTVALELLALSIVPLLIKAISKNTGFAGTEIPAAFAVVERALISLDIAQTPGVLVLLLSLLLLVRQLATTIEVIYIERSVQNGFIAAARLVYFSWLESSASNIARHTIGTWSNLVIRQCLLASQLISAYARLYKMLITTGAYAVVALIVNPFVTGVSALYGAVILVVLRYLMRRAKSVSHETIDLQNRLGDYLVDVVSGWKQVKVFNLQSAEKGRFEGLVRALSATQVRMSVNSAAVPLVFNVAMFMFVLGLVQFAGNTVVIDVNQLVIFVLVIMRLLPSLQAMASRSQAIVVNGASLDRVYAAYRDLSNGAERNPGSLPLKGLVSPVEFRGVSFNYGENREYCLEGLDIKLEPGKIIAVIGESGAGKSTLIDLIPRLIEPTAGEIRIQNQNLRTFDLTSLRSRIALATQEPFLFSASIAENVRAGKAAATDEEIRAACRLARIDDFVEGLPEKYQTVIGHGGAGLSGGQKQRLALARVFVSDADLILLDEPTSALDAEIESDVFSSIRHLVEQKKKMVVIITHRAAFMQQADVLIEIKKGLASRIR